MRRYTSKTERIGVATSGYIYSEETEGVWDSLKKSFADLGVQVYTVGFSADGASYGSDVVLKHMVDNESRYIYVEDETNLDEITEAIMNLFTPIEVTIKDELSKYVRYYDKQPDVKVTMKNKETKEVTTLYTNGKFTEANNLSDGSTILESVTYNKGDESENPTKSTGTVIAKFTEAYKMDDNYTYTLSFNVKITQTAKNEYLSNSNSYDGVTGDAGTDYDTNHITSIASHSFLKLNAKYTN